MGRILKALQILNALAILFALGYSYKTQTHFEVVVFLSFLLIGLFVLDFYYPLLEDKKRREQKIRQAELEALRMKEEKEEIEMLSKRMDEIQQTVKVLSDAVKEMATGLSQINEEVKKVKDRTYSGVLDLITDKDIKAIAEKSDDEKKRRFSYLLTAVESLRKKDAYFNVDVNELARCVFISKDCPLPDAVEFFLEKKISLQDLFDKVKELLENPDKEFEFQGKKYTSVVFKKNNCIYVNFAVVKSVYPDIFANPELSDKAESYFAVLMKDYLCPEINWKGGYIKRLYKVKEKGKESKRPLIALKSKLFENAKETENIELLK